MVIIMSGIVLLLDCFYSVGVLVTVLYFVLLMLSGCVARHILVQ